MKNLSKGFLMLLLISIAFIGCKKDDPCKDKNCGANATCNDGTCVCDEGYETDATGACVELRQKYFGTYAATETCNGTINVSWSMTIKAGSSSNISEIIFQNLGDYGFDVIGVLDGNNVTLSFSDGNITINGTGTFTGNQMDFSYVATNGLATDNCTGIATKQ